MGIEYLSAVLKENGHKTAALLNPGYLRGPPERVRKAIGEINPDLVAFSVVSTNYKWSLDVASKIKKTFDTPIVFGGPHPTLVPEKVMQNRFVDYAIAGEGEYALLELADSIQDGREVRHIRNVWSRDGSGEIIRTMQRPLIADLDSLPFPDKEVYMRPYNFPTFTIETYTIATSRGCPFSCTYCIHNYTKKLYCRLGPYVRFRSVENVIEELQLAKKEYNIKHVSFIDDNLVLNKKRFDLLMQEYKNRVNLPFYSQIHPCFAKNSFSDFKFSESYWVGLGVQSTNSNMRRALGRQEKNSEIKRTIRTLQSKGANVTIDIIRGLPGERKRDYLNLPSFFSMLPLGNIRLYRLIFFPKMEITELALKNGLISSSDIKELEENGFLFSRSSEEIEIFVNYFQIYQQIFPRRINERIFRAKSHIQIMKFFTQAYTSCEKIIPPSVIVLSCVFLWPFLYLFSEVTTNRRFPLKDFWLHFSSGIRPNFLRLLWAMFLETRFGTWLFPPYNPY